jgi:hypothetical protein
VLTSNCGNKSRSDIHEFLNYELATSRNSQDKAIYIMFCKEIAPKISKRYFHEIFMENFLNLMEDKQVSVMIAFLKTISTVRLKIDDLLVVNKVEGYLNGVKCDLTKKVFIREVIYLNS